MAFQGKALFWRHSLTVVLTVFALLVGGNVSPVLSYSTTSASNKFQQSSALTEPLVVGSKEYTESVLLGKMLVLLLREAGYEVEDQTGYGGAVAVREALEGGDIDLYQESPGRALSSVHNLPLAALPSEPEKSYELAKGLDADQGITWLQPYNYQTSFAVIVGSSVAAAKFESIDDLANALNSPNSSLTLCTWDEFYGLENGGLADLQSAYDFTFAEENILISDLTETYVSLRAGACDVAIGTRTDGRITAWNFRALSDPRNFFTADVLAPTIRTEILDAAPNLAEALDPLGPMLTHEVISQLNSRIDIGADGEPDSGDEELPLDVATAFLRDVGLLKLPTLVVGSHEHTESMLQGKMMVLLLRKAGYEVDDQTGYGGAVAVHEAMEEGILDLYPELTGGVLSLAHNLPSAALPKEPDKSYELAKGLEAEHGVTWLQPYSYQTGFAVAVGSSAATANMESIDDLAKAMNDADSSLTLCIWDEFYGLENGGVVDLQTTYGFSIPEDKIFVSDLAETYDSLYDGACDAAIGTSTDGRVTAWNFRILNDSRDFFPTYVAASTIRTEVLDANPKIAEILDPLGGLLTAEAVIQLNARVDIGPDGKPNSGDEELPQEAAERFLRSKRLLEPPAITVGSMNYTEELILGKILMLLLQDAGYPVVDKTGLGDAKRVRQALEGGEIDLYMEFNGTALSTYHKLPINALPNDPDRAQSLAKSLDEKKGIVWLKRSAYNNTYALKVGNDLWEQGIQSIEALATFMNANDAPLTICLEESFADRKLDGLAGLERRYGFQFKPENVRSLELNAVYEELRAQNCDIAQGYSTDSRGAAWGFHNLVDTLAFFPVYNASPIVRKPVLDENPELVEVLNSFVALLNDTTMSELNARVDMGPDGEFGTGDEEQPEAVAKSFLESAGLLKATNLNTQVLEALFALAQSPELTPTVGISATQAITPTTE